MLTLSSLRNFRCQTHTLRIRCLWVWAGPSDPPRMSWGFPPQSSHSGPASCISSPCQSPPARPHSSSGCLSPALPNAGALILDLSCSPKSSCLLSWQPCDLPAIPPSPRCHILSPSCSFLPPTEVSQQLGLYRCHPANPENSRSQLMLLLPGSSMEVSAPLMGAGSFNSVQPPSTEVLPGSRWGE